MAPLDTKPWWQGSFGYQIYIRSFADSNNDGFGDFQGIRSKIPYLKDLGVDFVWITPFYPSPMADWGYIGSVDEYHSENPEILHEGTHSGSSYIEHLRFREALLKGSRPEVGLTEGFWSVAVGEAAQLSIERKSMLRAD